MFSRFDTVSRWDGQIDNLYLCIALLYFLFFPMHFIVSLLASRLQFLADRINGRLLPRNAL